MHDAWQGADAWARTSYKMWLFVSASCPLFVASASILWYCSVCGLPLAALHKVQYFLPLVAFHFLFISLHIPSFFSFTLYLVYHSLHCILVSSHITLHFFRSLPILALFVCSGPRPTCRNQLPVPEPNLWRYLQIAGLYWFIGISYASILLMYQLMCKYVLCPSSGLTLILFWVVLEWKLIDC